MKLTKLYIHNYKSFYDTTIELDKMNIVVGENNSGKSNLIDVLEFIDIAMSKDIERAISDKGGYDRIKNYSAVGEEKVIVRATFNKNLVISFSFVERYSILSVYTINQYITCFKNYFENKELNRKKFFICGGKEKEQLILMKPLFLSGIIDYRYQLSTYYFNTQTIRDKSNQDSKYSELLKDGSNLGKILYEIKERDANSFEIISNSLITTVNEIDGIEVYKVAGNYIIAFKERGEEPIPIHTVSDGTINFLATITALNQLNNLSLLLVFEEPERHLHSKVVNYLLDSFRSSEKQILITTHSTEMLKYANLDEVIFIYRDSDGDTQTIRADKVPNLKEKMEYMKYERSMTLDEMLDEDMVWDFD